MGKIKINNTAPRPDETVTLGFLKRRQGLFIHVLLSFGGLAYVPRPGLEPELLEEVKVL